MILLTKIKKPLNKKDLHYKHKNKQAYITNKKGWIGKHFLCSNPSELIFIHLLRNDLSIHSIFSISAILPKNKSAVSSSLLSSATEITSLDSCTIFS